MLIFSARCFRNCEASSAIPPVVLNTSGVNVAFSTFRTLSLYSRFLFFSWDWYICEMLLSLLDWAWGWSTLTSVNALSSGDQNDLALMSSLAPSCLLVPLDSLSVWGTERSWGYLSSTRLCSTRSLCCTRFWMDKFFIPLSSEVS